MISSDTGLSEVFERYAAGLARKEELAPADPKPLWRRRKRLLEALQKAKIKGWPKRGTFYTKSLPPGCRPCLRGYGSNVCVTTRCNRSCFFCFNPEPRADILSVHGKTVASELEAAALLKSLGIQSVGLSGGEPLLLPERTLSLIRTFRCGMAPSTRLDLYTNGDLLSPELARGLKSAGLDGVRINLVANGFNIKPARAALEAGLGVDIEIPVIPGQERRLKILILELDRTGVPHLILHELFSCAQNLDELRRRGFQAAHDAASALTWAPVAGSYESALDLVAFALERAEHLSVYFCSTSTQQWIAEQALGRRKDSSHA